MRAVCLLLLLAGQAWGFSKVGTIYTTDGSSADAQAAINDAASVGDTVNVGAGPLTWSTAVNNAGKAVHIRGEGSGRVVGWSRVSNTFGTGAKTFTIQTGATIANGTTLRIWRIATDSDVLYMLGTVTSYNSGTGELVMNIATNTGSGTSPQWLMATEYSTRITSAVAGDPMIVLTESTAGSVELSGIKFQTSTGASELLLLVYTTNGEPILIHDCWFYQKIGTGIMINNETTNKGVIYECSVAYSFWAESNSQWLHLPLNSRTEVWSSLSTMGAADTTGKNGIFVEDCDFHGGLTMVDIDSNAKVVWRHNINNHAGIGGHGYDTSSFGARHWEFYDNRFLFANIAGTGNTLVGLQHHIRERGGTGVITDNYFEDINSTQGGAKPEIGLGIWCLGRWGQPPGHWSGNDGGVVEYPAPRQLGFGRVTGLGVDGKGNTVSNGVYVGDLEPVYIWGNTGFTPEIQLSTDGTPGVENQYFITPDDPADYIREGIEYKLEAKPGYVKYIYPHPLRTVAADTRAKILIQ